MIRLYLKTEKLAHHDGFKLFFVKVAKYSFDCILDLATVCCRGSALCRPPAGGLRKIPLLGYASRKPVPVLLPQAYAFKTSINSSHSWTLRGVR